MRFTILPFRRFSAAANMAIDSGMVKRARERDEILFRFYGWTEPAFTLGYSQALAAAPAQIDGTPERTITRVRRETGGGVVDHRRDLTYALVIPRSHPAWSDRPRQVYRTLHTCLGQSLEEWGIAASLAPCSRARGTATAETVGLATECFTRAEPDDLIDNATGRKLAGAAMRRHRDALLLQGSIERSGTICMLDDPLWRKTFTAILASALDSPPPVLEETWPSTLPEPDTVARFASCTWNAKR